MIIINFERFFKGAKTVADAPRDVVTVVNQRIKLGTALIRENVSFLSSFFDCQTDRPSVIGIIARVRVNLTIVACSKIDVPCKLSQELAVAVTDEVSLTAVPANMANP